MANSFQLIRTNPRISGNFKITVDSQGRVWFNTIDANKELADNKYKKFRVGGGSYETDLRRFMSTIPPNVLFDVKLATDPLTTPKRLADQYEFFYSAGASLLESAFYDEPYSYFAPMWLEDDIPNYFVIVRADNPLDYPYNVGIPLNGVESGKQYKVTGGSILYNTTTYTYGQTFVGGVNPSYTVTSGSNVNVVLLDENKDYPIVTSEQFERLLKTCSVIKTFDLSEKTTIGRYIRQIRNDKNFPVSPLTARFDNGLMTTWNGVAYQNGVFASKGELLESYWKKGSPMIGFDDYITGGFMRHGIVCANMLNLEFLFEDKDTQYYDIPRYLGFYVNAVDVGAFQLDGELAFNRRAVSGNTPSPVRKNRGFRHQGEDYYQNNQNGVKLYYTNDTGIVPTSSMITGAQWMPRMWCIRNKDGNFISIDSSDNYTWGANNIGDDKFLLVRDTEVNLGRLAGAGSVAFQSPGARMSEAGRSYAVLGLTDALQPLDELRVRWAGGQHSDPDGLYDAIVANDLTGIVPGWGPGSYMTDQFGDTYFHPYGTVDQVLAAIAGALNSFEWRAFDAIVADYQNEELGTPLKEIVIRFRTPDDANNNSWLQWWTLANPSDVTMYEKQLTPITYTSRFYFEGGTDSARIRLRFPLNNIDELKNGEVWLKTRLGLSKVNFVGRHVDAVTYAPGTDNPDGLIDFDKYGVLTIDNLLDDVIIGSTGDFMAYRLYNVPVSVLSFYPIKEMDGDFLSSTYARTPTQEYRKYLDTTTLVVDREYLVFADDNTHAIEYDGVTYMGSVTGTSFFATSIGGTSFTVLSGTPFVCPAIFYRQAIPHDTDLLVPGITYRVLGDVGDAVTYNSIVYAAGTTFTVPTNPILGETLRWSIQSGSPVVVDSRNILDKDIASFSGFWTLHDIVSINSEVGTNADLPSYVHRDRFFSNTVASEYDNLKENYLKEFAVYSRTFPSVSKWVYKGGKDVRDNPYRLNAAQVFGQLNFSPSFRVKKQNPAGFTHEWYYLEVGPDLAEAALENYYYFGQQLDYGLLTDADPTNTKYFTNYFTVQPGSNQPVQERYADVTYNQETGLAECFFRGVKVSFKEVQQDTQPTKLKGVKPPFIAASRRFDGYKFTAILRVIDEDKCTVQPPVTMTFAENQTTRTVTLVIDVVMDDYRVIQLTEPYGMFNYDPVNGVIPVCSNIFGATGNSILFSNDYPSNQPLTRNLDYFTLYSMRDKKMEAMFPNGSDANGSDAAIVGDVKLSTSMFFSGPDSMLTPSTLGPLRRIDTFKFPNYDTDLRDEITIIGKSCSIYGYQQYGYYFAPTPFVVRPHTLDFGLQTPGIMAYPLYADPAAPGTYFPYDLIANPTMYRETIALANTSLAIGSGSLNTWRGFPAWVAYGGTNYWEGVANRLSFGAIAERINAYSPLVRWKTFRWDGSTTNETDNEYYVELLEPSTIVKSTAVIPQVDDDKPSELTSQAAIGVNLVEVPVVSEMQRYSGPYTPAFRDVVTFYNQKTDNIAGSGTSYYIRSSVGEPWGETTNIDELNNALGIGNWTSAFFETADASAIFSGSTGYVFIDGSDDAAVLLDTFLVTNLPLIENWVNGGGNLFLNAAPNIGGNINFGFGVTLGFTGAQFSGAASISVGQTAHPIFNGPYSCGSSWTGSWVGHAVLTGGLTALIDGDAPGVIAGELTWGAGRVIFGAMTTTNFQAPLPQAANLRQNIHSYLHEGASAGIDLSFKRTTFDPNANGFGLSRNHGYLKVSDNNILALANNTKYESLYPLIHETAVDYRDLNVFQSAWDPGFWRKFVSTLSYSPVAGSREMKEVKNYFGTKIMRTPDSARLDTFTLNGPVSGPDVTFESVAEEMFWYEKDGKVFVTVNIGKRLARYFYEHGAAQTFAKLLVPEFGTGDPNSINDDVIEYLETNVVPAFDISLSDIYVKRYNQVLGLPVVRGDISDTLKKQQGYVVEKNISARRLKDLIYTFDVTPTAGGKVSIAPSFTITRI